MYQSKDDPRSLHSSRLLYEGLARLMREKAFDDITVTELVLEAQVGRATFYRNFESIEDVLRLRCNQVCEKLVPYIIQYQQEHSTEVRISRLKPMLRFFDVHSDIVELLIKANHLDMLAIAFQQQFESYLPKLGAEKEYIDYSLIIRIGVATSILAHWIQTGKQQTPDELADKLSAMIQGMVMRDQLF